MQILLIFAIFLNIEAEEIKIINKVKLPKENFFGNEESYVDICINGYVWRKFTGYREGSLVQVFENEEQYMDGSNKQKITIAKECK